MAHHGTMMLCVHVAEMTTSVLLTLDQNGGTEIMISSTAETAVIPSELISMAGHSA